jgi:hypothetical protein
MRSVQPSKALRLSHHVVFLQVRLDDLIDLYRRVFKRILSRELAKESPYTRYYLGTSNTIVWKEIATSFGKTLHKLGKIEHAEPQSITVADLFEILNAEPECVWLCPTLSPRIFTLLIVTQEWCTSAQVRKYRQNAPRPWNGSLALWYWMTGLMMASRMRFGLSTPKVRAFEDDDAAENEKSDS